MLFVIIPAAWLAVVLFVLAMCRLAARSDASRADAPSERNATGQPAEHEAVPVDTPAEHPRSVPERGTRRATG